MKKIYYFFFLFYFFTSAQTEYNITGYVTDKETGETLIGANIYNSSTETGCATNAFGYFNLSTKPGKTKIICSYIGYESDTLDIIITKNLSYNFLISINKNTLSEIELNSQQNNAKSILSSVINVNAKDVKQIPALLGEVDILKSIQLLPGVQSGSEGTSGFYVRGGGPDQNLILLDGVNIYHASHLLVFFSVFNEDAVKNINLTKGGFPARFGGRLSSILEIDMKEGNMKEWKAEGGMGLISGKITVQGPLKKDKTSILISARRTWLDLLKEPIVNALKDKIDINGDGNYYFYDINAKINHKFSDKDRIYFSFYTGKDSFFGELNDNNSQQNIDNLFDQTFNSQTEFGLSWQNITAAIRWTHIINSKIFANTSLIYGRYNFDNIIKTNNITVNQYLDGEETTQVEESDYLYRSGIEDVGIKIDLDYNLNAKHNFKFGGSYIKHNFFPGFMDFFADYENFSVDTTIVFSETLKPDEGYLYIEDIYTISPRLSTNIGFHYGFFNVNNVLYQSPEPRLSIRYLINENSSLKFSYATMQQNIHLLTNSSFGLPNDMWVPSTETVTPQKSQQIVLGYHRFFSNNQTLENRSYETSIELYYKKMKHLITFAEGTNILGTNFSSWEDRIEENGSGTSQGMEMFLKKKSGKLTGWIGYTLSKTNRQFENINLGNEYAYKFDRRHDLSVVAFYKIKKGINFNATFVYGTGNAITLPIAQYLLLTGNDFVQFFDYGEKNDFRMAPYHRLDVGCSFTKEKKWGERTWSISIYNIYNRKNPFFIYLQEDGKRENGDLQYSTYQPMQISLFPIIPSIRYSFKFK